MRDVVKRQRRHEYSEEDRVALERLDRDFRRSLYVAANVKAGARLTAADVRSIRPGLGLRPEHRDAVVGRVAARDLQRGEPLAWDMLSKD